MLSIVPDASFWREFRYSYYYKEPTAVENSSSNHVAKADSTDAASRLLSSTGYEGLKTDVFQEEKQSAPTNEVFIP